MDRYSMNFGKKERVLNYACQTYQLSRPNKVGAVMALIRIANHPLSKSGNHGISITPIQQVRTRQK